MLLKAMKYGYFSNYGLRDASLKSLSSPVFIYSSVLVTSRQKIVFRIGGSPSEVLPGWILSSMILVIDSPFIWEMDPYVFPSLTSMGGDSKMEYSSGEKSNSCLMKASSFSGSNYP
jgi:hypothetical protein